MLSVLYHCYADDSQLHRAMSLDSVQSQIEAAQHLSQCIQNVERWTYDNKLKLNPSKTEFMVLCNQKIRNKLAVSELMLSNGVVNGEESGDLDG